MPDCSSCQVVVACNEAVDSVRLVINEQNKILETYKQLFDKQAGYIQFLEHRLCLNN